MTAPSEKLQAMGQKSKINITNQKIEALKAEYLNENTFNYTFISAKHPGAGIAVSSLATLTPALKSVTEASQLSY